MSEKNEIEVIYVNVPNLTFLDRIKNFGADVLCVTTDEQLTQYSIPYILKSKYDELSLENARLAADLAKVEAELKECKEGFTKQIDEFYELRKVTIDTINQRNELLIENTKLKAELEKVKHENYILSTPISQEPLIAKDVPCTCDWQKVYPHLSVLCNPSTCKKTK